jgi:PAS domain S-box-containing protein
MAEEKDKALQSLRRPRRLDQEEARLWRLALWFLILLATGLAALSWERLQNLPYHLGAIPLGLLVLAVLFAAYVYGRRREVSEIKHLVDGLQDRAGPVPSEEQLDQLTQVIARSQRSFKELIDALDDVAFAMSLDGTLKTVNRRVSELIGLSYSQIVGHKLDEFLEAPRRDEVEAGLNRFLDRRHWSGVIPLRLKNGTRTLHFDCALNAIVTDGEVRGVSILARDVTLEQEKEKRFTELFEALHEGVYFRTPEGRFLDVNAALARMLGYESKREVLSLDLRDLAVEGKAAELDEDETGAIREREITLRRKDGSSVIVLDTSRAVLDAYGNVVRYQGTLVDISQRREMERVLQQQQEFQRYLLESFPDLILVVDLEEKYTFISSRIQDLLGYHPEELLGKRLRDWEQESPELLGLYREIVSGVRVFGFCETQAPHKDGSWRTARASASALYESAHKLNGVIISIHDITVEKKLEQQVIQSERLAAMGQMIGGFAHELNNPLTSILGISELLQDGEHSEQEHKHLTMLQQQARRATEIVQNLLYFSRPPAPGRGPVNLNDVLQRTLHLHAYSLRKNNITVDFLSDATLPAVIGDSHQLMQMFLNLIVNAEQAMREVRDRGTLRVRIAKQDASIGVTFQDDGPGIPAQIVRNIFDPFYTTKRPGRGAGLGLSICKAIVREHGGNIEAASGPGGGAVFTVTLPIASSLPAGLASSGS